MTIQKHLSPKSKGSLVFRRETQLKIWCAQTSLRQTACGHHGNQECLKVSECAVQLLEGGCLWREDLCSVKDVTSLRDTLSQRLTFRPELTTEFMKHVISMINQPGHLRAACQPMESEVCDVLYLPCIRDLHVHETTCLADRRNTYNVYFAGQ